MTDDELITNIFKLHKEQNILISFTNNDIINLNNYFVNGDYYQYSLIIITMLYENKSFIDNEAVVKLFLVAKIGKIIPEIIKIIPDPILMASMIYKLLLCIDISEIDTTSY